MKFRFFAVFAALGLSLACNQAPAGGPTTTDTAPAATVPGTGSAASGASGAGSGSSAASSAANPLGDQAKGGAPGQTMLMEMEVPVGAPLDVVLDTSVSSDTNKAEDAVKGHVAKAVDVSGMTTIPAGSQVSGNVVDAKPSGKVKGRALIAIRFNRVIVANTPYTIRTASIVREAEATKGDDAKKVGIGAGAGGGVVLATKGKEVSLASGVTVKTTFEAPVKINAPM
jgi:hypothetical protein